MWPFGKPLGCGSVAPEFTLPDQDGNLVTLSALREREVVLVFYPGDETLVCRKQLCEFRDAGLEGVHVLGINPQGADSHRRFRARHGFPFPLLVDEGQRVARLYQASGWFVRRTVYRIGRDGKIVFARRGKPAVREALGAVR